MIETTYQCMYIRSIMAKFVKGAVQQFKENKRRRTKHPEAQFMMDVGRIAVAKGIQKLFGFGRRHCRR